MEKRYIVAAALTFVVLIVWQVYFAPKPPPQAPIEAPAETGEPAEVREDPRTGFDEVQPAPTESDRVPDAEAVEAERVEEITIETALHHVVLTNRGGRVVS